MKLVITGNTPAQKNNKQVFINRRTGKPFIGTTSSTKDWQKIAHFQLLQQWKGHHVSIYPVTVTMIFFFDSKRPRDIDNCCATVMDALKHADVIEDDDYNHVDCIQLQYGGLDKSDPRVEVYIDES